MDLFPKFIIEGDSLILMKVSFHHQIVTDKTKVKGGGSFRFDRDKNTFIFHGDSHDFGQASFDDIKKCVEERKVFNDKTKYRNLCDRHKFGYDTGTEIINLEIK